MHARKGLKTAQSCNENWTELKGNAVASPYYPPLDQVHNLLHHIENKIGKDLQK